ncbi:hypothetical protein RHSIM_Rhsim09G0037200 [Rhododendron simsii]|uniref:S-protein homolog n=1 Tax=Rhododendron simsii TaxID=118357 RepID=A0A834GCB9_RHOSS|nr:hypothetical protein RHSIM_Rhsim09G0037200 [Rhododendron simsii]
MAITSECPNVPAPLLMHCESGDDDLGTHALEFKEARFWHFGVNFFARTLFHCHFKWDTKETSVDVYNRHIRGLCKPATVRDFSCYWLVKPDGQATVGFYMKLFLFHYCNVVRYFRCWGRILIYGPGDNIVLSHTSNKGCKQCTSEFRVHQGKTQWISSSLGEDLVNFGDDPVDLEVDRGRRRSIWPGGGSPEAGGGRQVANVGWRVTARGGCEDGLGF